MASNDGVVIEVQIDWEHRHLHQVFEANGFRWAQDLTPDEARMLADALVRAADRLESPLVPCAGGAGN